jgi:predicted alpha/beta-fold hydrolase
MQGIQLYPAPHAVGVYPQFYNHQTTVALKIREKALSLTGGDFDIVDATSQAPVFKVSGKHFSLHGRKGESKSRYAEYCYFKYMS